MGNQQGGGHQQVVQAAAQHQQQQQGGGNQQYYQNAQYQQMQQPDPKQQILSKIREKFQHCSVNGMLSFDKFNESLQILEAFGLRRLRDTPLGMRLFKIFDVSKEGTVNEQEFLNGMTQLIEDENKRIEWTYKAYDVDGDGNISKAELMQLLEESWITAFRLLADEIKEKKMSIQKPTRSMIDNWAQKQLPQFLQTVGEDFDSFDIYRSGNLDYNTFKKWVTTDRTVRASFAGVTVQVAVSFYDIQDRAYYPQQF